MNDKKLIVRIFATFFGFGASVIVSFAVISFLYLSFAEILVSLSIFVIVSILIGGIIALMKL